MKRYVCTSLSQLPLLAIAALLIIAPAAAVPPVWCSEGPCAALELLAEFNVVTFNWTGSPVSETTALQSGLYIPNNNIITGISAYQDRVFLCVPRWRSGVPSTLNELSFNATTGMPILNPFPSWAWQTKLLHYVQAVHVDQKSGVMYVIDAGRENFYDYNALQTTVNRAASLIVMTIPSSDSDSIIVSYNITFADSILPYNSSFLNDIRVDPSGKHVFMTDTNIAGNGAIISVDLVTGFQRRFEAAQTFIQPDFTVNVGGESFSGLRAPVDGIAISPDGANLYFSVVTGSVIYSVLTSALLNPALDNAQVASFISVLFDKGTASDGMDIAVVNGVTSIVYGGFSSDALMQLELTDSGLSVVSAPTSTLGNVTLSRSKPWLEWADTIVAIGNEVYFTTNRLPQFVSWSMDFSGQQGANMRVFRMKLGGAAAGAPSGSTRVPSWSIGVICILSAVVLVLGTYVISNVNILYGIRRQQEATFTDEQQERVPLQADQKQQE